MYEDLGYVPDPARLHRKEWEFAQEVYGLRKLRCLSPDAAALGLGAGTEPIIFFLAGRLRRVVTIELYAPDEPGDYRVELDMVREGVAWFSSRQPSSASVSLAVT